MERKLLRYPDMEARTGVPVNTWRYMKAIGDGPPMWKLGGRCVCYEDEFSAWLDQQRENTLVAKVAS